MNSGLQNIATATLCNYGSENDSIGGLFGYDFLNVDMNNRFADVNKLSTFNSFEHKDFKNKPPQMPDQCMGFREVIWVANGVSFVRITETSPVCGRQYYNYFIGGAWNGWKCITP